MKLNRILVASLILISVLFAGFGSIGICETSLQYEKEGMFLKELGVFKGDGENLLLNKVPTRNEAAVMIVRLLGRENTAVNENNAHPFEDVPLWASPYVGYLYKNNLTSGVSETEFGGANVLLSKHYAIFMMRVLEYKDNVDFTWNNVMEKAKEFQVIPEEEYDSFMAKESFRRDDLAGMTYWTLKSNKKDTEEDLISALVNQGSVDRSIAESIDKIANVAEDTDVTEDANIAEDTNIAEDASVSEGTNAAEDANGVSNSGTQVEEIRTGPGNLIEFNGPEAKSVFIEDLVYAYSRVEPQIIVTANSGYEEHLKAYLKSYLSEAFIGTANKYFISGFNYSYVYTGELEGYNVKYTINLKYGLTKEAMAEAIDKAKKITVLTYAGEESKPEFTKQIQRAMEKLESKVIIRYKADKFSDISKEIFQCLSEANTKIADKYEVNRFFSRWEWLYFDNFDFAEIQIDYHLTAEQLQTEILRYNQMHDKIDLVVEVVINDGMNDYQKEKALHDYLVKNVRYDIENFLTDSIPDDAFNAKGAILNGSAVCNGYARAMKLLLNEVGIASEIATGEAKTERGAISHAWNVVNIDGELYHVDVTWDDPISDAGVESEQVVYTYFNVPDEFIGIDHTWVEPLTSKSYDQYYYYVEGLVVNDYEGFDQKAQELLKERRDGFSLFIENYSNVTEEMIHKTISKQGIVKRYYYSFDQRSKVINITKIEYY